MKNIYIVALLFAFLHGTAQGQNEDEDSCYGCHLELDPPYSTPAEQFTGDVHASQSLDCTSCHGGDNEAWDYDDAKDPAAGFIGRPSGRVVVETCGKCHSEPEYMRRFNPNLPTDQVSKYWTSGHGKSLLRGNAEVALCSSCHGAHGIKPVADRASPVFKANVAATCAQCHGDAAIIAKAGLDTDIVSQYTHSIHGEAVNLGDFGAPTCNTCHGNHGAAPPDVGSIQEVCGTCHPNNQRLFDQSRMRQIFSEQGRHGCTVCHTAHDIQKVSDTMVSYGQGGVCAQCHEPDSPGSDKVLAIRSVLDSLNMAMLAAAEALGDAESRGLDVEPIYLDLQLVRSALVQSRTQIHAFDPVAVAAEAEAGFVASSKIIIAAQRLIDEFRMRKVGLGISTLILTFFAAVLYLYIRTLDAA